MRLLGKSILVLACIIFLVSIYTLFWPSVIAEPVSIRDISLTQNGYSAAPKAGIDNFLGGETDVKIVKYTYVVKGHFYVGHGLTNSDDVHGLKVFYCPWWPSFTLTKNGVPLFWLVLLILVGVGILEINKWLKTPLSSG